MSCIVPNGWYTYYDFLKIFFFFFCVHILFGLENKVLKPKHGVRCVRSNGCLSSSGLAKYVSISFHTPAVSYLLFHVLFRSLLRRSMKIGWLGVFFLSYRPRNLHKQTYFKQKVNAVRGQVQSKTTERISVTKMKNKTLQMMRMRIWKDKFLSALFFRLTIYLSFFHIWCSHFSHARRLFMDIVFILFSLFTFFFTMVFFRPE